MAAPSTSAATPPARTVSGAGTCPLPYPDRFHAAAAFVEASPEKTFNDETRLLLYALGAQVTRGPVSAADKPWAWNVVESAMWEARSQLGSMPAMEAMRLYVRTLDEDQPGWWLRMPPGVAGGSAATEGAGVSISRVFQPDTWVVIQQDDAKKPLPRYEQGAALLGSSLFVLGGHYGGRYLQDSWVYDLNRLQWTPAPPPEQPAVAGDDDGGSGDRGGSGEAGPLLTRGGPPPSAGWSVTPMREALLVLGGHVKAGKLRRGEPLPRMAAWLLDPRSLTWTALSTSGDIPCARGGHSAVLLPDGERVLVYGGEDSNRRPLGDAYVLDLQDLSWGQLQYSTKVQPPARSGHAAAVFNAALLVFGGGSLASCFSDLWALDLSSVTWTQLSLSGPAPSPRAGHGAALVGNRWYCLGGGNNVSGCTDMLMADLSQLPGGQVTWSRVCSVPPGSPLSSEGVSLLYTPEHNLLVAFGGYNGRYHNAVSVYKLPGAEDDAAAGDAADTADTAHEDHIQHQAQRGMDAAQQQQQAAAVTQQQPTQQNGDEQQGNSLLKELALSREQLRRDLNAARQELELVAGAADAAKQEAAAQINMLSQQLATVQASAAAADQAAAEMRQALSSEQARTLALEAQVAELTDRLGSVAELERELARYRRREAEAAEAAAKRGGLWAYVSGAS